MFLTCPDGASHRIERLKKAAKIATAMCGLSNEQANLLIAMLADVKGVLHVHWLHEPTAMQRNAFAVAWEQCKEQAANVVHHTKQP